MAAAAAVIEVNRSNAVQNAMGQFKWEKSAFFDVPNHCHRSQLRGGFRPSRKYDSLGICHTYQASIELLTHI